MNPSPARGLERDWEQRLADLEAAKDELACRLEQRPHVLGQEERDRLLALGADLATVWDAPTTAPRDRKELLRALIEEVILSVDRDKVGGASHPALEGRRVDRSARAAASLKTSNSSN